MRQKNYALVIFPRFLSKMYHKDLIKIYLLEL